MTKIKICGIKTIKDALAAIEAGADLIGFNFYPKSPRYVEVGMCRNIMSVMRQRGRVICVGVFVNASLAEICATMETCGLSLAQLHGDETPEMLNRLHGKAFKAVRLSSESVETSVYPFLASVPESAYSFVTSVPESMHPFAHQTVYKPAILVDAAVQGLYGGSGVTADWNSAAGLAKQYPLLLAGGLTPKNVAAAVRQVKPWGVDVASGVESAPGEKDTGKMVEFVKAVRAAESK
jgi:phosphoribosylanthranilate isomerase